MFSLINNVYLNEISFFGISILIINIINYLSVFLIIISLILMCNISKFKSLNQFKEFNSYTFILYTILFSLLSMAGIPPLLGFTGKFLSIIYLNFKSQYVLVLIMFIINMFSMYFYIQNIRFVVKKTKSSILFYKNYYINLNYSLSLIIVILNILNIFGFLFISDLIIIINCVTSYIYL
jgi:NADH-quinone oxidoreductase subunit N